MTQDSNDRMTDADALQEVGEMLDDTTIRLLPGERAAVARILALATASIAATQKMHELQAENAELRRQLLSPGRQG